MSSEESREFILSHINLLKNELEDLKTEEPAFYDSIEKISRSVTDAVRGEFHDISDEDAGLVISQVGGVLASVAFSPGGQQVGIMSIVGILTHATVDLLELSADIRGFNNE